MTATLQDDQPLGPSDEELVRRVRSGDHAAYDLLVQRHQKRIYGLTYQMTSNREDAQDLAQEIFVKAFTSLNQFKGDSGFYTWIYRIAVNRTLNFLKQRGRRKTTSLDDFDEGVERDGSYVELVSRESPIRDIGLSELQEKLNEALQTLSEDHRTVVVMHDIQGKPHDEIAQILGVSSGTVRSRLFYARQLLQNELGDFLP